MNVISHHWDVARRAVAKEKQRGEWLIKSSEVDFLPAALEIVERQVSPGGRIAAYLLAAVLLAMLLWLTLGEIDVVASALGRLMQRLASSVRFWFATASQ